MTLPTMNPGDRVRITVEGVVRLTTDRGLRINLDGADQMVTSFYISELTAPTARVEVLPPPVDPDLVLAREWLKGQPGHEAASTRMRINMGDDRRHPIQAFLAGFAAAVKLAEPVVEACEALTAPKGFYRFPRIETALTTYRQSIGDTPHEGQ